MAEMSASCGWQIVTVGTIVGNCRHIFESFRPGQDHFDVADLLIVTLDSLDLARIPNVVTVLS